MANRDTKKLKVWETGLYYKKAREGSLDTRYFGMKVLKNYSQSADSILDLGCGEGTRLSYIAKGKNGVGIDLSEKAISLAKKNYPKLKFVRGNLEKLPFKKDKFDLVFSAFVLEHLRNPEKVLSEAIRVTKRKGKLILMAPNYGAPNRASPVFRGSRIIKFIKGFAWDIVRLFKPSKELNWYKVVPKSEVSDYIQDADTTIEPYLGSLENFLKDKGLRVLLKKSLWEEELKSAGLHQKFFRFLGENNLYPFSLWGPHLVIASMKT